MSTVIASQTAMSLSKIKLSVSTYHNWNLVFYSISGFSCDVKLRYSQKDVTAPKNLNIHIYRIELNLNTIPRNYGLALIQRIFHSDHGHFYQNKKVR